MLCDFWFNISILVHLLLANKSCFLLWELGNYFFNLYLYLINIAFIYKQHLCNDMTHQWTEPNLDSGS